MTEMTRDRARALLAAYGADPGRWPAAERAAAERLAAADPVLAAELAEAQAVDALLDALPAPAPSPALRVALKDIPDGARLGWSGRLSSLWPFGAPWRPAAGLVAAAVLGIFLGIVTSEPTTADSGITTTFIYDDDPIADAAAMASGAGSLETLP
jgi:hypothetical protein